MTLGVVQLRQAPVDVLPEFTPPYAEIQTEALGLSAEEVEQLITVPLEADLLNGVEGVDVIRSESLPGLSSIVLVFARGTNVYRARQLVEERLTQAHALPNVSKPPTLLQPLSSSNRVLMIGMSSSELSLIEQSVIARWTVRPQLMGVEGVANVSVWGMRDQQLQVQVDPARLRDQRVTLSQVVETAGNAQVVSPLTFLEASTPGTGGFIETPQQRLQVRHLLEKIADPAELAKVPVEDTGGRLTLGDVATVKVDHQPLIGDAVVGGGQGLFLVVEKFPGVSSTEVTAGVEEALETLRPGLSGISTGTTVFRPADYVADALQNLRLALLIGGLLMVLALVAFGFQWRALVTAAVTVPLSLVTAGLVMTLLGHGLNALLLAGLAAAVAVVVDEAVAPAGQVLGGLRRNGSAAEPKAVDVVVAESSAGIRPTLMFASVVAALGIVPLAVLEGRPGAFFSPLVLAYLIAVAAAFLVAVTVAQALSSVLFARWKPGADREWGWSRRLAAGYEAALSRVGRSVRPLLLVAGALVLVAAVLVPFLRPALMPDFQDRNVQVRLQGRPGASNQWMTAKTTEVATAIESLPGVDSVGAHVGRAVTGDRVVNVSSSDVWVTIAPNVDYQETLEAIKEAAGRTPELGADVVSYSTQKMRDVGALVTGENPIKGRGLDVLTGLDQPLAVRLYGQDPVVLNEQAAIVQKLMAGIEGVVEPRIATTQMQPTIEIEVDLAKAQAFGVTPGSVRRAEATLLQGIQVGSVFEDQAVFDVIVQGVPSTRRSETDVRNLLIDRPDQSHVTLGQVAAVRTVDTPAVIKRDAVSRRVDIVAGVQGRSAGDVTAQVERQIATLQFPLEYHAEVLRNSTADEIALGRVVGFSIAGLIAAFLLFQAAFRSWRLALVMAAGVPVALTGGVLGTLFTGRELSLGALLGLLAVFGLVARTGMLMITELQAGGSPRDRIAPVLTTTLALIGLSLPFVVLGSRPGLEILHPLAVVMLGGLVTATLVTLFFLPVLSQRFIRRTTDPVASEPMGARPETT
jgi:Cu/Ag efflux pump CusA